MSEKFKTKAETMGSLNVIEYAKFEFTKSLSDSLNLFTEFGNMKIDIIR